MPRTMGEIIAGRHFADFSRDVRRIQDKILSVPHNQWGTQREVFLLCLADLEARADDRVYSYADQLLCAGDNARAGRVGDLAGQFKKVIWELQALLNEAPSPNWLDQLYSLAPKGNLTDGTLDFGLCCCQDLFDGQSHCEETPDYSGECQELEVQDFPDPHRVRPGKIGTYCPEQGPHRVASTSCSPSVHMGEPETRSSCTSYYTASGDPHNKCCIGRVPLPKWEGYISTLNKHDSIAHSTFRLEPANLDCRRLPSCVSVSGADFVCGFSESGAYLVESMPGDHDEAARPNKYSTMASESQRSECNEVAGIKGSASQPQFSMSRGSCNSEQRTSFVSHEPGSNYSCLPQAPDTSCEPVAGESCGAVQKMILIPSTHDPSGHLLGDLAGNVSCPGVENLLGETLVCDGDSSLEQNIRVAQITCRLDVCDQADVAVQGQIEPKISQLPIGPGILGKEIEMKVHDHIHNAIGDKPEGQTLVAQPVSRGSVSFSNPIVTFVGKLAEQNVGLLVWCLFVLSGVIFGASHVEGLGELKVDTIRLKHLRHFSTRVLLLEHALDPELRFDREGIGVLNCSFSPVL